MSALSTQSVLESLRAVASRRVEITSIVHQPYGRFGIVELLHDRL
jgi:hypothetical protein